MVNHSEGTFLDSSIYYSPSFLTVIRKVLSCSTVNPQERFSSIYFALRLRDNGALPPHLEKASSTVFSFVFRSYLENR